VVRIIFQRLVTDRDAKLPYEAEHPLRIQEGNPLPAPHVLDVTAPAPLSS
jgi:hypothetical protein